MSLSRSSSRPNRPPLARRLLPIGIAVVALVLAHLLDAWAYAHLQAPRLAETDLGRMLRVLGFLPLWLVVAAAIALGEERAAGWRRRLKRGGLVLGAGVIGGLVAELAKILIRRQRPDAGVDGYVFRPWDQETFHTGGLGLPSSHALVAFAALAMLGHLYPRARPLWWLLGAGCAYSRVASGAHFLSDVVASAALGWAVALVLWKVWGDAGAPTERAGTS